MTTEYVVQDCNTRHSFDEPIECPFCEIERLRRQVADLQDAVDSRDKALGFEPLDLVPAPDGSRVLCVQAAGFEEVPSLSPEAQQAFRAAVQEIDGVNLREVERLRGLLRGARVSVIRDSTAAHHMGMTNLSQNLLDFVDRIDAALSTNSPQVSSEFTQADQPAARQHADVDAAIDAAMGQTT